MSDVELVVKQIKLYTLCSDCSDLCSFYLKKLSCACSPTLNGIQSKVCVFLFLVTHSVFQTCSSSNASESWESRRY